MEKILFVFCFLFTSAVMAQEFPQGEKMKPGMTEFWDPEVVIVAPGATNESAPSDALILFDGQPETYLQNWVDNKGEVPGWKMDGDCITVVKGTGGIQTKEEFEDFQLHIEWRTPSQVDPEKKSQARGNSGIFMQKRYELQVLDNNNNRTYRNGQAGSFYKQSAPLVNVCKKPGEWQTYDIVWTAPRFKKDSTLFLPARATVFQNGVLVQNNVSLSGPTEYIGIPQYKAHGPAPLMLQEHGNAVSYRNIWIRKL